MKKTIGILAHVDAGKTTFSEQLLYHTGSTKTLGLVDNKSSYLDTDEIERQRGITIFSEQAIFSYYNKKKDENNTYYLIDTPGHIDFSYETEKAISILDYAILLINGSEGVQSHTATLFHLLEKYHIPTFFFLNKSDMINFNLESNIEDIKTKLSSKVCYIDNINFTNTLDSVTEFLGENDDNFLELYMDESYNMEDILLSLTKNIKNRLCFPILSGSALKDIGIDNFLEVFDLLTDTDYENKIIDKFLANIYKIRHDEKNNRILYMKLLSGRVKVKQEFLFESNTYDSSDKISEKINELRIYNGEKYSTTLEATAGDIIAVVGLKTPLCGNFISIVELNSNIANIINPNFELVATLQAKIIILDNTDIPTLIQKTKLLEDENPMLNVSYSELLKEIHINVCGKIQLEVLKQLIFNRFKINIDFEKPEILYRETIANMVIGYGHFEPLRHYAEVHLRLSPNKRGEGITFESECHVDTLSINYQKLIKTHIFERTHKGILTGSPLTDVKFTLLTGRAHIKHTEGGDFREATYRAIRQGLEQADNILLEPYYKFEIFIDYTYMGRVLSDIPKLAGSFNPPVQNGNQVYISGRGPVATFMDYSSKLVSFTKGTGSISLIFDDYDICHNAEEVIENINYDKGADIENTSCSVFCAKGTSFVVNWNEAKEHMHCI